MACLSAGRGWQSSFLDGVGNFFDEVDDSFVGVAPMGYIDSHFYAAVTVVTVEALDLGGPLGNIRDYSLDFFEIVPGADEKLL